MRFSGGLAVLLLLLAGVPCVDGADSIDERAAVFGRWATSGTIVEVTPRGDSLSARLVALKHPLYREKDVAGFRGDEPAPEVGSPKRDHENPDPTLRHRPLLGIELLQGYEFRHGLWQGRLYFPETGRSFGTRLSVQDDGRLKIRGYLFGLPWLGRTELLVPVSDCNEDILRMLAEAGLPDCAGVSPP